MLDYLDRVRVAGNHELIPEFLYPVVQQAFVYIHQVGAVESQVHEKSITSSHVEPVAAVLLKRLAEDIEISAQVLELLTRPDFFQVLTIEGSQLLVTTLF